VKARVCPTCETPWHSSGWQGRGRVRCDCGTPLNLSEAQLDRELIDECQAVADEFRDHLSVRNVSE
jgi:tRNA(Ile2) C34 agmatinyltransferase TiaS